MIKKILYIALLMLALPLGMRAASQFGDSIWIDGVRYELLTCPLDECPARGLILPANIASAPNLTRGYTGYWSLRDGVLYLDSIQYCRPDSFEVIDGGRTLRTISPKLAELPELEPWRTDGGILAGWYTGVLRTVSGKMVLYYDVEFFRFHERETYYAIREGRLVEQKSLKHSALKAENRIKDATQQTYRKMEGLVK